MTERTPLQFALDIPFVQALGMQLWRFDGGFAEISLALRPEMMNSRAGAPRGRGMTRGSMRPATGRLMATGPLLHGTRSMAFCEGSVRDGSGALCAHATGTFK